MKSTSRSFAEFSKLQVYDLPHDTGVMYPTSREKTENLRGFVVVFAVETVPPAT